MIEEGNESNRTGYLGKQNRIFGTWVSVLVEEWPKGIHKIVHFHFRPVATGKERERERERERVCVCVCV